jgi:hypothetical protein
MLVSLVWMGWPLALSLYVGRRSLHLPATLFVAWNVRRGRGIIRSEWARAGAGEAP